MAIIHKYWWLLSIVVFYFNSAFAIQVQTIREGHTDYTKAATYIEEVASIAGKTGGVVLKVYLDGWPEVKFSNGKNRATGSIQPEDFFNKDSFYQEAARLLYEHNFPIDKFYFPIILEKSISSVSQTMGKGVALFESLEKNYQALVALEAALKLLQDPSMEIPKSIIDEQVKKALTAVQEDAKKYIKERTKEHWGREYGLFVNSWFEFTSLMGVHRQTFLKMFSKKQNLKSEHLAPVYQCLIKKEGYCQEFCLFYHPSSEAIAQPGSSIAGVRDVKELQLRLYCNYWGKHTEDALIYRILQNLREYRQIPRVIEIYGNEDPCFQCQVKLQWLVDHLTEISPMTTGSSPPITISYYSKGEYSGQCLHVDFLRRMIINYFTTRKKEETGEIKKFTFTAGDHSSSLEAFVAPIKVLREKKLLRSRMLRGYYEGKILEVNPVVTIPTEGSQGGMVLKIELRSILSTSLCYMPIDIDMITDREELEELRKLYNGKKNICLFVSSTVSSSIPFAKDQIILFKIIGNNTNIESSIESELIKRVDGGKNGFYGVVDEVDTEVF